MSSKIFSRIALLLSITAAGVSIFAELSQIMPTHGLEAIFWQSPRALCVAPYIQPGRASELQRDTCSILWQCEEAPTSLRLRYRPLHTQEYKDALLKNVDVRGQSSHQTKPSLQDWKLYAAEMHDLALDNTYEYEILENNRIIHRSSFKTRKTGNHFSFVVFGDSGSGTPEQAEICRRIQEKSNPFPDFVLHTGDFVYEDGRPSEYLQNVFPYYNSIKNPQLRLMSKIPFYVTPGNHDIGRASLLKQGILPLKGPDLYDNDILGYFYYLRLPLNGPELSYFPQFEAPENGHTIETFIKNLSPLFPKMLNYSFDFGNAHFVVLDGNYYQNQNIDELVRWLDEDLRKSKAFWKFVSIHQFPFSAYMASLRETKRRIKRMSDAARSRLITLVCQKHGVDIIFSGDFHAYERQKPLQYQVKSEYKQPTLQATLQEIYELLHSNELDAEKHPYLLDALFNIKVDTRFDGKTYTKPSYTLFIISGAGGNRLHAYKIRKNAVPEPYAAKANISMHSFTHIKIKDRKLFLTQIDKNGKTIDQITIAK
jgi:hypothetical protein